MSERKHRKLNWLEQNLPEGLLVDAAWMTRNGYSSSLRSQYVSAGWLEQPARGVYKRPIGALGWRQVVISLQTLMEFPVVVGGRTALEEQGYAHFLSHETTEVHLYGQRPLPGWVDKLSLKERFVFHNSARLFRNDPVTRGLTRLNLNLRTSEPTPNDPLHAGMFIQPWGHWDWPLTLSTPERAALELLDELPDRESFHQVDKLFEGLASLSPRRLETLLADCCSVKVKRLFFFFMDRHAHRWASRLDPAVFDLGSGKRMLVRGGRLDKKYEITVPEGLDAL